MGNVVKRKYYGKVKEYKIKKIVLNLTFYFYLLLQNKTKSFCGFLFSMENQALNIVPQIYKYSNLCLLRLNPGLFFSLYPRVVF